MLEKILKKSSDKLKDKRRCKKIISLILHINFLPSEKSSRINNSRLRKMQARNDVLLKIVDEAEIVLAKRIESDRAFYRELLKNLIIQVIGIRKL